ncbi:hypothetical protein SPRG_13962 [Saprolegnia parasitica CBS 223.65]|uniref:U2A'/phosphoprotein 32 family A C-terminal domain-containing protein n=1 Tax=Saprolegnia parasitica (strain CBS 223.65) TaxID=695850 RepID=A0A067BR89_SAPPC|nr:hypothetical protein SPRG_13962 [Saprolegnia parasitica CBS 223.65]KDO21034.1 hypothetical protein SPRG_13962 [Saprolegnia parasitica CBS 223.65]|eukprot:XP_012208286.1 hypothetical protein SPRG_13962 [Saprolegnia parasitica CBS 223.65]
MARIDEMRVSEPHKELAVANEKYVKNCTELVLAHREIDVLGNFEPFVSLEVLWINDNNIEKLTGLDTCFRIKYLFAQNNRISTVDGSLLHFTFLRELRLFNNRLQDLHATLRTLSKLLHLHDLDLFGNPLAEEENYRLHVIAAIPSLEVFDRHVITPDERIAAKKLHLRRPGHAAKASNNHQLAKEPQPHEWSGTVKMLMKEVSAQEEAERKKQFQMTDASFTSQTNASNRAIAIAQNATVMDEWDLCHLRKAFRAADPRKRGWNTIFDINMQLVFNDYVLDEESSFSELLAHITRPMTAAEIDQEDVDPPTTSLVTWALFSQGFTQGFVGPNKVPLRWQPLPATDVAARANEYFEKTRALQKRMLSMAEPKPDLIKQMHALSQKAYHLQSLCDQRSSGRSSFAHIAAAEAKSPARDAITVFSYTKVCPSKDEKGQNDPSQLLAKKYAIKDKDFQSYLKAKDARRPIKVTKDVVTL